MRPSGHRGKKALQKEKKAEEIVDERHSHQSEIVEDDEVKFKGLHELDPSSGSEKNYPFDEKSVNLESESAFDIIPALRRDELTNFSPDYKQNQLQAQRNGNQDFEPVPNQQDYSIDDGEAEDRHKLPR